MINDIDLLRLLSFDENSKEVYYIMARSVWKFSHTNVSVKNVVIQNIEYINNLRTSFYCFWKYNINPFSGRASHTYK